MPRCLLMLTSFFDRFLIDFCSRLGPPEPLKSMKNHWFYKHSLLCGFFKINSICDTILVPTCFHFPSPTPPQSHQKSILAGIDFLIDFFSIWARFWSPTWRHVGFKNRSGGHPKCLPRRAWEPQAAQTPSGPRFSYVL